MLNLDIYLLSLEIVVEASINHQKLEIIEEYLKKICIEYDEHFKTNRFQKLLERTINFYQHQLIVDNDSLFIEEAHIPELIKNNTLITQRDKILVYVVILSWAEKHKLPNPLIYGKIASSFKIPTSLSEEIGHFLSNNYHLIKSNNYFKITPQNYGRNDSLEGEWINDNIPKNLAIDDEIVSVKIDNPLHVLFINEEKNFLTIFDDEKIKYAKNGQAQTNRCCLIESGDTISINNQEKIGFAELKKKLVEKYYRKNFHLSASHSELKYNKNRGIKAFNFIGQTGELIGIVGREGSGKSTMLKLLSGIEPPKSGSVFINGYDIQKYHYQLNGFVGYVPEEDLLYPELTSYDNLVIAAQLYLRKKSYSEIKTLVEGVLFDLDLWDIRDEKIGKLTDKFIQPGQRRLLNIALELLRDPEILIIDNSLSSLSMNDSAKVLEVLHKLTFKGKLIITTITQVSNKSFEYFDNLFIIDYGGIPVFFGPRSNALNYLLCFLPEGISRHYVDLENFSPEVLLDLLNKRGEPDANNKIGKRYIDSLKLYSNYIDLPSQLIKQSRKKRKTPGKQSQPPRLEKQFLTYFIRNFKTKIARKKDLTFTIFAAPLIAFILATVLRNSSGENYTFNSNPNIPSFFFISIIVNIFIGLGQSIREVLREKYGLKKEEFLNLSMFSYINSKVAYLFLMLIIQSFLFTLIASSILEIKGMLYYHWIVYFTCGSSGALLGLIFSATHKVYDSIVLKSVPISIILFILFGGGWIPLKDINFTKDRYTPLISNLSPSRWAYEAIMVQQYVGNSYEKDIYSFNKEISRGSFNSYHMLPKLKENLDLIFEFNSTTDLIPSDTLTTLLSSLKNRLKFYEQTEDIFPFEFVDSLAVESINSQIIEEASEYLSYLDYHFYKIYNKALKEKSFAMDSINSVLGTENLAQRRIDNVNSTIAKIVRNTSERESLKLIDNHWMQFSDPIYQKAHNNYGRTQFFLPEKRFNNQIIKTFEFNLSVMWLLNFLFYIILITDLINRLVKNLGK